MVLDRLKDIELIKSRYVFAVLALLVAPFGMAQKDLPKNLPKFDERRYHFGFILAYNSADFMIDLTPDFTFGDSLLYIKTERQPGFNLGPLASLNFNKNVSLRFIPDISFQDRKIYYGFLKPDSTVEEIDRRVESTYINFPLNLKLRTDRVNNFAAYALGGFQWGLDMATQKGVNNVGINTIVKIKDTDYAYQVGGGVDFFLPYFKFGLELKLIRGIPDLLIHDGTRYASPIERMRSRVWLFSLTFEG